MLTPEKRIFIKVNHFQSHRYSQQFIQILKMHVLLQLKHSSNLYFSAFQNWFEKLIQDQFLFTMIAALLSLARYSVQIVSKNFVPCKMLYCCIFLCLFFEDLFRTLLQATTVSFVNKYFHSLSPKLDDLPNYNGCINFFLF